MQIIQIKEVSSMVNVIITNNIVANSIIPEDPDALRKEAIVIQKEMPEYSVDRVMMLLMIEAMVGPYLELQPEVMEFFMNWIAAESKVFDVAEFNKNSYIKNIDFVNQSNGDYELRYYDLSPYELDIYNIPKRIDELCVDIPRVSCFTEEFKYPVIFQKSINSTWMSVSPNEVFTMEKPIKNAKGKVLTLGCGMGYFAYMASINEDVLGERRKPMASRIQGITVEIGGDTTKLQNAPKHGISRLFMIGDFYDTSTFHLPRHKLPFLLKSP